MQRFFFRAKRERKSLSLFVALMENVLIFATIRGPIFRLQIMKHLTEGQRYQISCLLSTKKSQTEIANIIGVHKSTISREIKRNCDKRSGKYNAELAHRKSQTRLQHRNHYIRLTEDLKLQVGILLKNDYSPEQITGYLARMGMDYVSHETIYQHVWKDKKIGSEELYKHLRRKGRKYRKRGCMPNGRGFIKNRVDIDQRPSIVDEKSRFGDLEIDTVIGKNHKGALLTINDRATGLVWIRLLSGKEAAPLTKATIEALMPIKELMHTITADNGKEFSFHEEIARELNVSVFFAKPYHSWERGANENTNGLIRQYFPKGTDFGEITHEQVYRVQGILNSRPRKRLGYLTPKEKFKQITNMDYNAVAFSA